MSETRTVIATLNRWQCESDTRRFVRHILTDVFRQQPTDSEIETVTRRILEVLPTPSTPGSEPE
jgi:hypothetical protein